MVFFFKSTVVDPPALLYMGLDKHENEELIAWGWPEDVWFHVDKLSSAHVYLRLQEGQSIDTIPKVLVEDAAQLVKANSIMGNKQNDIDVVYTMWENLHKTSSMDVGQIGFHKSKAVKKVRVEKRDNAIVNRLNKTKEEKQVDFRAEKENKERREREAKKKIFKQQEEETKRIEKERREEAEKRSYDNLMQEDKMKSNLDNDSDSDDFM